MQTPPAIIDIRNLAVTFRGGSRKVRAVNGVDLTVDRGEVLALLGESGSGKSVTLRSLLRLHPKGTLIEGEIKVAGQDVMRLGRRALADLRGGTVSMIFQEPRLALDPVYRVGDQIVETIRRHMPVSRSEARARALRLFEDVRIPSPESRLGNYPHEMSGGMLQRSMIAMALACDPAILLADEPTTALDATVQIQILLLLRELQTRRGLAVVFVTHDIGVAAQVADKVAVMYAGRIVESGHIADVIHNPRHPYTQGLLDARVELAQGSSRLRTIEGAPPDLSALPPGCAFAPRCGRVAETCRTVVPELHSGSTSVACFEPLRG
ncbi:peptide/nickel transport system ATP-binding protein [Arboricoccus pini]|uniref:Peptide/nickel transport system ATP-binding protein n=1 Tax=Arboricoccus pini TaxID=1963835 RepID=A0A212RPZ0_9PROT|nr:ABC transporter ATP-binding protein [Arboricoccus pini]SNB74666.1 peptide/nickel transport system ATP-binding protein [Arboricoccus pini]